MKWTNSETVSYKVSCLKGGSGGGGGSGKVDYPQYMKDAHQTLLGSDMSLDTPVDVAIDDAMTADPYAALSGYDPSSEITDMENATSDLKTYLNNEDYREPEVEDALTANPYTDLTSYDPSSEISDIDTAISGIDNTISDLELGTAVDDAVAEDPYASLTDYNPSSITAAMANHIDDLDVFINSMNSIDEIEVQLSKFDAGMRDINAVVSSAYGIGKEAIAGTLLSSKVQAKSELAKLAIETRKATLEANKDYTRKTNELEVSRVMWPLNVKKEGLESAKAQIEAKKASIEANRTTIEAKKAAISAYTEEKKQQNELDIKEGGWELEVLQSATQGEQTRIQAKQQLAHMTVESRRVMIVANKEFNTYENELEVAQAKWSLEALQHGGNMLAAISGAATTKTAGEGPSKLQSAIGGAAAGGAMGGMMAGASGGAVAGPVGVGVGAAIGLGASLL